MTWGDTTRRAVAAAAALSVLLSACAAVEAPLGGLGGGAGEQRSQPDGAALTGAPAEDAVVVPAPDPAQAALGVSRLLWREAPVAVVAPASDAGATAAAVEASAAVPAPVLLLPDAADGAAAVAEELGRLGTTTVVTYGKVVADPLGDVEVVASSDDPAGLPSVAPPEAMAGVVALVPADPALAAARASAAAAGARVVDVTVPDPRAESAVVQALATEPVDHVVALGEQFGTPEALRWRSEVAATGVELPGGGQLLFPGRRMVALYGHPGTTSLGVLGEQGPAESVARAQQLAAEYDPYSDEPVVPAFEIIATIASSSAGGDGDYSSESTVEKLRPLVDAAAAAGVYVVLDLQPGRTDFLTQAQLYEELLRLPHVGLALDPEWRLAPGQVHLRQIGRVDAAEVDAVADWLAGLVR